MADAVMLDSTPLGMLAHPRRNPEIAEWYANHLRAGTLFIIPEIADYEVRRSFLHRRLTLSIRELDALMQSLAYRPITTTAMLAAAELWADARRHGRPTADPRELDADVILAAQAIEADAIIATENVSHLARYVVAKDWREILAS